MLSLFSHSPSLFSSILEVEDSRPLAGTTPIYTRSATARCSQFLVLNQSVLEWISESSVHVTSVGIVCMARGPVAGCHDILEVEDSRPLAGTTPIYTRSATARCSQFLVLNQSVLEWISESSVHVTSVGIVCMARGPVAGCHECPSAIHTTLARATQILYSLVDTLDSLVHSRLTQCPHWSTHSHWRLPDSSVENQELNLLGYR
uniref:Uncharacterized protein n=1 Tax=Timema monikensis TaxID=170555 RepID=A0A7R9EHD3_9NEOP|nr:unnamed protein product [Timema monikensis]